MNTNITKVVENVSLLTRYIEIYLTNSKQQANFNFKDKLLIIENKDKFKEFIFCHSEAELRFLSKFLETEFDGNLEMLYSYLYTNVWLKHKCYTPFLKFEFKVLNYVEDPTIEDDMNAQMQKHRKMLDSVFKLVVSTIFDGYVKYNY